MLNLGKGICGDRVSPPNGIEAMWPLRWNGKEPDRVYSEPVEKSVLGV
jgi:hypothetical protein